VAAALAAGGSCGGSGKGSSSKAADRSALSAEVQSAAPGDIADRRELLVVRNRAAA
jgi:hypothetical protein